MPRQQRSKDDRRSTFNVQRSTFTISSRERLFVVVVGVAVATGFLRCRGEVNYILNTHLHDGLQMNNHVANTDPGININLTSSPPRAPTSSANARINNNTSTNVTVNSRNETLLEETQRRLSFFYMHIPKTGGYYAFSVLSRLLFNSPEYQALAPYKERFRHCNVGSNPLSKRTIQHRDTICTLIMSEQPYHRAVNVPHVYTVVRNPHQHVLSQYFHCTESHDHRTRRHLMPSLDVWLESWVQAMDDEEMARRNKGFRCYDPRNLQSRWSDFGVGQVNEGIGELNQRFEVIGDMDRLEKSICVIFILYAGWVPRPCDCTNKIQRKRRLSDHGVTHHGASYKPTPQQEAWIANLTEKDNVLYGYAKQAFEMKVKLVEDEYDVRICEKIDFPPEPVLDCGCPSTCNSTTLSIRGNNMPFTCKQRIQYLMQTYGSNETDACAGAVAQGACTSACDKSSCLIY